MMKKTITIGAVLVLSLFLLTGCGNRTLTTMDEAISVSGKVSAAKKLEAVEVEEVETKYAEMERYLEKNASAYAYYDIVIADENGNPVQPEEMVQVKIKLTDELAKANGTATVFYVNGENMTRLDCVEADGYVSFWTDHFSVYVVAKYEEDKSDMEELAVEMEMVIPHIHKFETDETTALEPTCTVDGKKADEICSCGDKVEGQSIPALGHDYLEVADSVVEATCDTQGKSADTKCDVCGDTIIGEVIPAIGHQFGDYVYNNDATTKKDGTETATCTTCGGTDTRIKAGTKIEITYDGYDEFGNGYVWCYDGAYAGKRAADSNPYKVFDVSNPYPTYQAVWVSNTEVYFYGIYGSPSISLSLQQEMAKKNGVPFDDRIKTEYIYKGKYSGKMVFYCRVYM